MRRLSLHHVTRPLVHDQQNSSKRCQGLTRETGARSQKRSFKTQLVVLEAANLVAEVVQRVIKLVQAVEFGLRPQ